MLQYSILHGDACLVHLCAQDTSSPDLLAKFALAANAGAAPRSPMWFGSTALQEEILSSGM
jgi:hypothetical protein